MKFLWPGGGVTHRYGVITAPNHRDVVKDIQLGKVWAGDLGCLQGPKFVKRVDFNKLPDWLEMMAPFAGQCLFLAGADIVGNSQATFEAYQEFRHYFGNWPVAYVAQNGAENLPIPDDSAAVFIAGMPMDNGGDWKDSLEAVSVIKRAQAMGKHIHIGRVNGWTRYSHFASLVGSEDFTCDGTRVRFDGRENTHRAYDDYESRPKQMSLLDIERMP